MPLKLKNQHHLLNSILIHFTIAAALLVWALVWQWGLEHSDFFKKLFVSSQTQPIPFELIEPAQPIVPVIPAQQAKTQKNAIKKIYGIQPTQKTSQTIQTDDVISKVGNTLAKAKDTILTDHAPALPVPTDLDLLSVMPKVKKSFTIPYPTEAKKNNLEGPVILSLIIDEFGKVRSATLLQGTHEILNQAALNAIRLFEFTPGLVEGKPVVVKIKYTYRFILSEN